jgi:hypothetical protein
MERLATEGGIENHIAARGHVIGSDGPDPENNAPDHLSRSAFPSFEGSPADIRSLGRFSLSKRGEIFRQGGYGVPVAARAKKTEIKAT